MKNTKELMPADYNLRVKEGKKLYNEFKVSAKRQVEIKMRIVKLSREVVQISRGAPVKGINAGLYTVGKFCDDIGIKVSTLNNWVTEYNNIHVREFTEADQKAINETSKADMRKILREVQQTKGEVSSSAIADMARREKDKSIESKRIEKWIGDVKALRVNIVDRYNLPDYDFKDVLKLASEVRELSIDLDIFTGYSGLAGGTEVENEISH